MSNRSGMHLKSLKVGTSSANWSVAGFQITEVKPGISTCVLQSLLPLPLKFLHPKFLHSFQLYQITVLQNNIQVYY